jgi:hypothetical protein
VFGIIPTRRFKLKLADPELKHGAPAVLGKCCILNGLGASRPGLPSAFSLCMTVSLILFGIQLALTLVALLRERSTDSRFENDKLIYKS